jgi:hypothetical protein
LNEGATSCLQPKSQAVLILWLKVRWGQPEPEMPSFVEAVEFE